MREELLQLWDVIVYGHAKINSACNNLVEKKCAFQAFTDRTSEMEIKMWREHLCSLQMRENLARDHGAKQKAWV